MVELKLRFLKPALHRRLVQAAARNDRSLNAEINHRLEQSFRVPELTAAIVAALESRFERILALLSQSKP